MKNIYLILGAAMLPLLIGCASTPVVLAPVGPNPLVSKNTASGGGLQVFSNLIGRSEGNNPTWYQHTDYYIYDLHGQLVKHVNNTTGYYAKAPCRTALPVGEYIIQARAKDYGNLWIKVPVVIQDGKTTRVHLDKQWMVPTGIPKTELVSIPIGYPVGWRAD